jgi:hypothetical protein
MVERFGDISALEITLVRIEKDDQKWSPAPRSMGFTQQ